MLRARSRELRIHYIDLLKSYAPNMALTFNFGYLAKGEVMDKPMKEFFCEAQREVYGRNWSKQYDREFPIAMGFLERPDLNPHYHVLARVDAALTDWIMDQGPAAWVSRVNRGQLHAQEIYDPEGARRYWTKRADFENVFVYKDTRKRTIGSTPTKVGKQSGWL